MLHLFRILVFTWLEGCAIPPHLHDAWSLIRHTAPANTLYQHRPTTIVFPDAAQPALTATCQADCSGLTNSLLTHAYNLKDTQLSTLLRAKRPLARHYFSAILNERGFARIHRATDINPGDLIAIRYEPGASNTGHVMIAASRAVWRQVPSKRAIATTPPRYAWHVLIIDSSSGNRGTGDLRYPGLDPQTGKLLPQTLTGLGVGWYTLPTQGETSASDVPSDPQLLGPESTPAPKRPLVIGRVNPRSFAASNAPGQIDDTAQSQHD